MFCKLALKNIRRSIKDYAIYFFTLVLSVAVFYVFNAIESQTVLLDVTPRMRDMIELTNGILSAVSILVSLILGFLIIYASRFLIKRRSKEFGIYLTLGMSKRKISTILLLETLFIGLISLAIGLLAGVVISQFTSVLVANMFEANLTRFTFVFSVSAMLKSLLYFGVIYLIVMIFNTVNISRQKLINLLSSSRRSEKVKMKNPWVCTVVFLVACAMLAWSYWMVTAGIADFISSVEENFFLVIATGVIATFLLFWSLSGLLLRIFTSLKGIYYRKLNSFTLRQFSSKINTTVASMSLISLMLFVTICVLSSALSVRNYINATLRDEIPVDIEFVKYYHTDTDGKPEATQVGSFKDELEQILADHGINADEIFSAIVAFPRYESNILSLRDTLGELADEIELTNPELYIDSPEEVIHLSEYNALARAIGNPELSLASDEYAIVANYQPAITTFRNPALAANTEITIAGKTLRPKYSEVQNGSVRLSQAYGNDGVIIIPDSISLDNKEVIEWVAECVYRDNIDKKAAEAAIEDVFSHYGIYQSPDSDGTYSSFIYFNSRQEIIDNSVSTNAMVTFIGLYLGIIFLISSAAVLALKELSESSDNRDKFTMLRKIGTSEKMLTSALFWQIAIFFAFPLLVAIIHSIFGIKFCSFILEGFGGMDLIGAITTTAGILILIYGGYFLITFLCSKNIIREHRH